MIFTLFHNVDWVCFEAFPYGKVDDVLRDQYLLLHIVLNKKNNYVTTVDNHKWFTNMVVVNASDYTTLLYFKAHQFTNFYPKLSERRSAMQIQKNGWMIVDLFCDWLQYLCNNILGGVTKDNKHHLILNGHCSHINATTIATCLEIGVELLSILAYTSNHMQHLDIVCFFTVYAMPLIKEG